MVYVFRTILFQGWSLSFKVTMYNVSFFSLLSLIAILEAVLDVTFSIYAAKGKSRHLPEHFVL